MPFGEAQIEAVTGVSALGGEVEYSALERIWGRPTAEINGFGSGFQGEGTKTIIPKDAFAKLTFRLVPGQHPETVLEFVRRHFEAHCPDGVRLEVVRRDEARHERGVGAPLRLPGLCRRGGLHVVRD